MQSITLVCTRHDELGACNSIELYKILEHIKPEIIFEEIPPSFFNKYYLEKSRHNLESDAINEYIKNYQIVHVPVDSDDLPSEEFFNDHRYMLERIEALADINGFNYRNLIDHNRIYIEQLGFKYLNSIDCSNMNDEIYSSIEHGLQSLNKEKHFQIFKLWKEINEKRENHMLNRIYEYSHSVKFDKAVFTIGSAHRKSIILKISERQKNLLPKLNWDYY